VTRRRLLIALAIVSCLGYATWWMCWRGDPRFVGRWNIVNETGDGSLNEIVFEANGTGVRQGSSGGQSWTLYKFRWWIDGGYCVLQRESPRAGTFEFRKAIGDLYGKLTGYSRRGIERRLRFERSGENRMRVWQVDGDNEALGHVFEIAKTED